VNVGDNLDAKQVGQLRELFNRFLDAFSINGSLGRTDLVQHEIELLEGSRPFMEPLRRHPKLHEDETRKQVQEMLAKDIIEPSKSPW
jgi:hypothetical protein